MAEEVRLYDIRERNYPNQRNDSFRSLQVFECAVCEALTNLVVMGGAPGLGTRTLCSHSSDCWHHDLAIKIQDLRLEYKNKLPRFREMVDGILGGLRRSKILTDDIVGNPDLSLKSPTTNSFSKSVDKKCLHHYSGDKVFRLLDLLYP
ncbi:MAG: hypothetical protein Q8Q89_04345 [bacterium]|nr:hypothetical protein [bacterium]